MKKKVHSAKSRTAPKKVDWQFDSTEFLLLVVVAGGLLVFFGWQTGLLSGLESMVLGASTSR